MTRTDFKRTLDCYRAKAHEIRVVDVPPLQYLMVDGHGDPNTAAEYAEAVGALFPLAYALKFASRDLGRDHVVMPLEALWWADDLDAFTASRDKSRWRWTTMIMVPDWITSGLFGDAVSRVRARSAPAGLDRVRLQTLHEGVCVQTLHLGAYDDEAEVLARIHHQYVPEAGLRLRGKHHEIYLSDARRVAPSRLRTILRQPVERAGA